MRKIIKAKETMSAKTRVQKTFNLEKTDRVTIGYEGNIEINKRMMSTLGTKDIEELYVALGVDYRGVGASYTGQDLFEDIPGMVIDRVWGHHMKWIEHKTGGYWDICHYPLAGADDEKIANFPLPSADDFVEMGIKGVDTLQPEATNMSPQYLKDNFGGKLCFRGCISTAGPLAYGSSDEVREYCKKTLQIMMNGYGYHFAPTHSIQDNTPCENVISMYQAAHDFGVYN